jgi:hypothetical protein
MAKDNHNTTVWQGYVAAIASLAQSMLFLMAVLTIALTQIAQQIGKDEVQKLQRKVEATDSKVDSPNQTKIQKQIARLKIVFVGNALELDKQQRRDLSIALNGIGLKPSDHIRIWCEYTNSDSTARRSGYLRILSIRSVLIGNGISDERIEMNLVTRNEELGSASEMNVYIDPIPKARASNR